MGIERVSQLIKPTSNEVPASHTLTLEAHEAHHWWTPPF